MEVKKLKKLKELKEKSYKYFNEEKALDAVERNGFALQYVKEQTLEICLEAVKQNGDALQYVQNQTPELCLEAVKQNGYAIQFVNPIIFEDLEDSEMIDLGDGIVLSKASIKSLIKKSLS